MRVGMHLKRSCGILCALGISLGTARAQTPAFGTGTVTLNVKANFRVGYVDGDSVNVFSGMGTLEPFGPANITATQPVSQTAAGAVAMTITFLSGAASILVGDSFQTSGPPSLGGNGCVITSTLTGGTGVFANAVGTLNINYACSPDAPQAGSLDLSGTGSITVTITLDESCQANSGSPATIDCENQAVAIDPPVVGTPFELHYQSERVPGRNGVSSFLTSFVRDLGGWTLDVRHAYDPVSGNLYLGSGSRRRAAVLGSPPVVNGNYLITDKDASEVYVFDKTGRHLRTVQAVTGALIYEFRYDSKGHLITVADSAGNVTTFQRDSNGNPSAIIGPYGQRTAITINAEGYTTQITNPNQESIKLTYGAGGLLTSTTDPLGNTDNFQYNSQGLLTHAEHAGGASETLIPSASPGGLTLRTASGATTTFLANLSTHGAEARTITYPSGVQGRMQSSATSFSADRPDGTKLLMAFGPDPRWGIQAPVASAWSLTTPSGTQLTETETRTVMLNNSSDPFSVSSLTETVTINGQQGTATYNGTTRALTKLSPAGRMESMTLDGHGRVAQQQIGGLDPTSFTYDDHGRFSSLKRGGGSSGGSASFAYNSQGYLSSVTDPTGRMFGFEYDGAGRIAKLIPSQGMAVLYGYNARGDLTSLTPAGRNPHTLAYSPSGRVTTYSPPTIDGVKAQISFSYNADGRVIRAVRGDQAIDVTYDSASRLSTLNLPTYTISYTYDAATGKLTAISGPGDVGLSLQYDGGMQAVETWTGQVSGAVSNTFDNNFFLVGRSVNSGSRITFQFNADGALMQAGALGLARDTQTGLLTGTAIDNIVDTFGYDSLGQESSYSATANGSAVYSVQYVRDSLGRIAQRTETIQDTTDTYLYTYDAAGQLIGVAKDNVMSASYSYDSNGNRLSFTGASGSSTGLYDAQDRLTSYGTSSFAYRDDGQLRARSDGQATTQYQHDAFGNLLGVTLADGTQITYLLDGQGRRLGKQINGSPLHGWLYQDRLRPVAELDGSNNVVSMFVYADWAGAPAYMVKNGTTYRIISDERGSPRLVVDTITGTVAQRLDYSEFGEIIQDTNPGFQPFGFAGGLYDPDTGLVHFGARDYDPHAGRWTAKDPILFAGGDLNLYAYALNDPVNIGDASGLATVGEWLTALGNACGAKTVQAWDWINDWARSKLSKQCLGPACISTESPEITIGTSKTVGPITISGEAGAGITTTPDLKKPFFSYFLNIGAKLAWISKDLVDIRGETGQIVNYQGLSTQLNKANQCQGAMGECP